MPVLNNAENINFGGEQVLAVMNRGVEIWAPPLPENTVAPVLSGGTSAPADLSVTNGTWTNSPTSYRYQLQEFVAGDWEDVSGETTNSYDDLPAGSYSALVWAENSFGESLAAARSNTIVVTSGTLREFGFSAAVGPTDGFPGAVDRALASPAVKSNSGTVTKIMARFRSDTAAGANARICAYTNSGGAPGTLLWSSQAASVPAGGGDVEFGLPLSGINNTDPAATYQLVMVPSDFQPNIAKSNNAAFGTTRMANGTFDHDSPPSTWPGTDATYDGPCCIWCEYIG